ncbi:MAG: hypothetical protein GF329_09695 [Candidatus Lokiarchaeota archaeon]|nr:hypothetical protein [Candidatus Lokiarchaeota archaeon]
MIKKPTIIVSSAGRTGTLFFCNLFNQILNDSFCIHETDRFTFNSETETFQKRLYIIKKIGIYNITIKKIMGNWGIRALSDKMITKKINCSEASGLLLKYRKNLVNSLKEKYYVECSYHYYGLIDILDCVFSDYKLIFIVRDGRDWVRSMINKKGWYQNRDYLNIFNSRLNTKMFNNISEIKWTKLTNFEKLCWSWYTVNSYAIKSIEKNKKSKLFRFEDIFKGDNRYKELNKLITFATSLKNNKNIPYQSFNGALDKKANISPTYSFPNWKQWSYPMRNTFNKFCASLMDELGYGNEKEWNITE